MLTLSPLLSMANGAGLNGAAAATTGSSSPVSSAIFFVMCIMCSLARLNNSISSSANIAPICQKTKREGQYCTICLRPFCRKTGILVWFLIKIALSRKRTNYRAFYETSATCWQRPSFILYSVKQNN